MNDFNVIDHEDGFEAWAAYRGFNVFRDGDKVFLTVENRDDRATVVVKLEEFKQWLEQINKIVNK